MGLMTVYCVGSIARLVCAAALSDHSAVAGANLRVRHSSPRTLRWLTPSRTDDSLGIRTQRPAVRHLGSNFLRARSQCLQGEPLDDSPLPNSVRRSS